MKNNKLLCMIFMLFATAFMFNACGGGDSTGDLDSITGGGGNNDAHNDSALKKPLVSSKWMFKHLTNTAEGLDCIKSSDFVFFKTNNTGLICTKPKYSEDIPYDLDMGFTYKVNKDEVFVKLYNGFEFTLKHHLGQLLDEKNGIQLTKNSYSMKESEWVKSVDIPHGMCGDSLTWVFNDSRSTLYIGGKGDMYSYSIVSDRPWKDLYVTRVVFGEGTTSVGYNAFSNMYVSDIVLPQSMKKIDNGAFYNCSLRGFLSLPSNIERFEMLAFANNPQLSITFSDYQNSKTKYIGPAAFSNIGTLKDLNFPNSLEEIQTQAFDGTFVNSVHFNEGLEIIADSAFTKFNDSEVILPSSLVLLGYHSFIGSISSVSMGKNINLDKECVVTPEHNGTLYIERSNPPSIEGPVIVDPWGKDMSPYWKLFVPLKSLDLYKNKLYWSDFKDISGYDFSK